jgi:hypothetical protein
MCSLSPIWLVVAVTIGGMLAHPMRAECEPTCDSRLVCLRGQYLEDDPYLARYPALDHQGLDTVQFCKKDDTKNLMTPIENTKVVGFTQSCQKVFEGEYNQRPMRFTFLWPSGALKHVTNFGNDNAISDEHYFNETGVEVRFSDVLAHDTHSSATFPINAAREDAESFAQAQKNAVRICSKEPEAAFEISKIEDYFHSKGVSIAYSGTTSRSAVVISDPQYNDDKSFAKFYYFSLDLQACSADSVCNAVISSYQKTASVVKGVIQIESSTNSDDNMTSSLIEVGKSIINRPIIWCYIRTLVPDLRNLLGSFGRF